MIRATLASVLLTLLLVGCVSTAPMLPTSPRQGIAYGYATVKTVADAVATARQSNSITKAEASKILDQDQKAEDALNMAAQMVGAGNSVKAGDYLSTALTILTAVQQQLQAHKGVK